MSMGFFRKEYCSGLPCPPPGDLPDPGIEPKTLVSPALAGEFFTTGGKESACNMGNLGSISGSGRSPGGGHGNPLQYSCLKNSMDRGVSQATVHGVAESDTTE